MSGQSDVASPKCPLCGKPAGSKPFAPFCGRRCADLDLGRWLKGGYAIPGAPAEEAPDSVPNDGEPPEND